MGKKKRNNVHVLASSPKEDNNSVATPSAVSRQVTFDGLSKQSSDYYIKPSGKGLMTSPSIGTLNRLERQKIVIWRRPLQTLRYAGSEMLQLVVESLHCFWQYKGHIICLLSVSMLLGYLYRAPGAHQKYLIGMKLRLFRCFYWIGLGVLSSIGLGTGLHTFILYLGPHIATVTMAAYECSSLDFPEPPYPDSVVCPHQGLMESAMITMWAIMSKVRFESLLWGAGTALGELPPYFVARAARMSGEEIEDDEYREFVAWINRNGPKEPTLGDRFKVIMEKGVTKLGFLGILLFASIPNPFFDLAGITCGHFLVPFWKFFLATLIGKAIFKMHLQTFFVVLAFSERSVEQIIDRLRDVPVVGIHLRNMVVEFLAYQKDKLHSQNGRQHTEDTNWMQMGMSVFVSVMFMWFFISIVNSLAQKWHKRLCDAKKKA